MQYEPAFARASPLACFALLPTKQSVGRVAPARAPAARLAVVVVVVVVAVVVVAILEQVIPTTEVETTTPMPMLELVAALVMETTNAQPQGGTDQELRMAHQLLIDNAHARSMQRHR